MVIVSRSGRAGKIYHQAPTKREGLVYPRVGERGVRPCVSYGGVEMTLDEAVTEGYRPCKKCSP